MKRLPFALGVTLFALACSRAEDRSTAHDELGRGAPVPAAPALPSSLAVDVAELDPESAAIALKEATAAFDQALSLAVPDCATAHVLRERICRLSEHICRLAHQDGVGHEMMQRCEDAKARCASATERVGSQCG